MSIEDYPFFERLLIFNYSGVDKVEKSLELAELLEKNAIDFVAYNATKIEDYTGFVVRKSGRKWKDIIALTNSVKPMAQLHECKYYFKYIRFSITDEHEDALGHEVLGNIKEYL